MARYTGPKSRIARKFGEGIFGADKVLSKKNYPPILPDSTVTLERERLLNTVCNFVRSRKLNILTVYWKNNSVTCLRRQLH